MPEWDTRNAAEKSKEILSEKFFSPARMHHGKDALYCLLLSHIIKVICQYSESMTERQQAMLYFVNLRYGTVSLGLLGTV